MSLAVPQGCILPPIIFSLYINGVKLSPSSSKTLMYADDVSLSHGGNPPELLKQNACSSPDVLSNYWFNRNALIFNCEETVTVQF